MKVLILGSTGMLGHVVKKYLESLNYQVLATTRRIKNEFYFNPIENIYKLEEIIKHNNPEVIINCIGVLNKAAEDEKHNAILINSYLPHYIDDLSKKYNFKFIHISTDCVFEGTKGNYTEESTKDAQSFYGKTKALGEIENSKNITLRTSIIGPDHNADGIGLFNWFMKQTGEINGFSKVIWTGVTTIELAKQIELVIKSNLSGLYHVINGDKINKYELLRLFNKYFNKDIIINKEEEYKCDKSLITTKNDYIFNIPSYEEMIKEMYLWIEKNKDLYDYKI